MIIKEITFIIDCDTCSCCHATTLERCKTEGEAAEDFRKQGWVIGRIHQCPGCVKEYKVKITGEGK